MAKYKLSPLGDALYPWLSKPDTKFNAEGLFKTDLALSGSDAVKFKEEIDEAVEEAFAEVTKDMTAKERNSFKKKYPYQVETDDDDNATGRILFFFRQNAKIKLKDGSTKDIKIGIYDAKDKETNALIGPGSVIRLMYSTRPIKMAASKEISIRLDFAKVQIKTLKAFGAGGAGFGSIEGGFESSDEDHGSEEQQEAY